MLTAEQKAEMEKKLKAMSSEIEYDKVVKQTIKLNTKAINDLTNSLKQDSKAQKQHLIKLSNLLINKIISLSQVSARIAEIESTIKSDKQKMNQERFEAIEDKGRLELSIKQIKDTIQKIQKTVTQSVDEQAKKRQKIQSDMEKSLGDIQEKIVTFDKQSEELSKQNQTLSVKKKEIQQKMSSLEIDFKKKAEEKDEEVKKQKDDLMVKLQALEVEMSEITQINKQFSTKEKSNFDKKLSLYLRTKKFPEYSSSFENSAKTIDQCKEELLKGVQRMNDAKQMVERFEKQSKQLGSTFLVELKKKVQNEGRVEILKKEKEIVRDKIIALQNKIKEKKQSEQK